MFDKLRSTAKNTIFYSISNFAGKFSGVILLPLYTSSLSAELFGLFALFEVVFQVIQGITGLGLKGGLMRWYWDEKHLNEQKEIFFSVLSTYFLVNIVSTALLYLSFDLIANLIFQVPVSQTLKLVFLLSTFIRLMVDLLLLLMRIQHKAKKHTNYQLIQIALFVGAVAVFLPILNLGVEGIFMAFLVSYLIPLLMLMPYLMQNIVWHYRKDLVKDMMAFGLPIALSNMVNLILSISDKFIINFFGTLKNVGNYTLAFKISNIVQLMIVNAFMNSYTHVYYKGMKDEDNNRFFSKTIIYLVLILSFVSLGLVLFIEDVVKILTLKNADYLDSIAIIPVLTLGLIFGGLRSMLTLPLTKFKKTKTISIISVSTGLINVGLNILSVPQWGTMGAAISTLIVQIISVYLFWVYASKLEENLLDVRKFFTILTLTIALGSIIYVDLEVNYFMFLLIKILILTLWLFAIWKLNMFDDQERLRIKQGWDKWKHLDRIKQNLKSLKE